MNVCTTTVEQQSTNESFFLCTVLIKHALFIQSMILITNINFSSNISDICWWKQHTRAHSSMSTSRV